MHLIKQIIASEWIQPQGLKYIFASLYNVGLLLYRNKQVNEVISYGCDFYLGKYMAINLISYLANNQKNLKL